MPIDHKTGRPDPRARGSLRAGLALALAIATAIGAGSAAAAEPAGTSPSVHSQATSLAGRAGVTAAPPMAPAAGRPFSYQLREPGDFVSQYTDVACVGASTQIMLNMMRPGADRRPATQARLLRTAQRVSNRVFVRRFGGASALGWAYSLERAGGGPYRVRAFATRSRALRAVAEAIRTTGRPAGLLVWQGAHAWVVGGFRSTADPLRGDYRLTGVVIDDPWWPRATSSRGRTLEPGSVLSPAELARHFVPFQRGPRRSGSVMNGTYVVVLPIERGVIQERAKGVL